MTHPVNLDSELHLLRGIGPQRAALLQRLGLHTVADLLWYLPRDVLDLTQITIPAQLTEGTLQTVRGWIVDVDGREISGGRTLTSALLDCRPDYVRLVWFNQPWMRQKLRPGDQLLCSGKPKRSQGRWEFSSPRLQWLTEDDEAATGGVIPRYGLTEGLRQLDIQRIVRVAVEQCSELVADPWPESLRKRRQLPHLAQAIRQLHLPGSKEEYELARTRLLFDDLLEFQLGLALRRRLWRARQGAPVLEATAKIDARIRRLFPFRLTPGQNTAIQEIAADLQSGYAMHRLLQADVGAGKTVVAIYAMLVAVAHGWQAVLMAPTELLALQHWQTIQQFLQQSRVERALLTGSLTAAQRRETLQRINAGELQLVVGTQAVIQEGVSFPKLGVAVIDEQHKFGVAQRSRFAATGEGPPPHVLVMTATPIPRSLCLTQFGDLDLTVVKDRPQGRQPVITSRITGTGARKKAWEFIREQLRQGRQLYIVCPLVSSASATSSEAGAGVETSAAEELYRQLPHGELAGFRIGLVHGQQDRAVRSRTMEEFREHELDAIVCTTVIEVGVDVPNATLMIVLQAEQFGVSQLHQLRGRVARGIHRGFCFLFSEAVTPEATARLSALERTDDGFQIAETDFELRGPGDVLGTRQHGELPLRCADLVRDKELLVTARDEAFGLVRSGEIDQPEYAMLKVSVLDRFGEALGLPRTG